MFGRSAKVSADFSNEIISAICPGILGVSSGVALIVALGVLTGFLPVVFLAVLPETAPEFSCKIFS